MKIDFKKALIILVITILTGILYNSFSAKGVSLFAFDNKKLLTERLLGKNAAEPKEIGIDEALELHEAGVLFLDARDNADYVEGHIKDAVNIPYYDIDNYMEALEKIPKDEPVVTYCSGTDCDLSHMLGNELSTMGYKKVFIFFGGWNDWSEGKYPVEKSE